MHELLDSFSIFRLQVHVVRDLNKDVAMSHVPQATRVLLLAQRLRTSQAFGLEALASATGKPLQGRMTKYTLTEMLSELLRLMNWLSLC